MNAGAAESMAENSGFRIAGIVCESWISLRLMATIIEKAVEHPFSRPLRIAGHQRAEGFVDTLVRDTMCWNMLVKNVAEQFVVLPDAEAHVPNREFRADLIACRWRFSSH